MYSNRLRFVFVAMCVLMLAGGSTVGYFGLNTYLYAVPPNYLGLVIGFGLLSVAFLCLSYISSPDTR